MPLDSAQAKVIAAQPRIIPEERDRLVSLLAEGKKPAELAVQFGKAVGTIYNFQTRNKDGDQPAQADALGRVQRRSDPPQAGPAGRFVGPVSLRIPPASATAGVGLGDRWRYR
jgi:hypothetical protein